MKEQERRHLDFRIIFAAIWLGFTTALAVWMLIFNTRFFEHMKHNETPTLAELERHYRMVSMEMSTLIVSLLVGGSALFILIDQERRRSTQVRTFFATFTHELKTSISRLRLQAEGILEDFKSDLGRPALQLLEDLGRLEVQLENSLFLARGNEQEVFIQELRLSELIAALSQQFPLQVRLTRDAKIRGDARILDSVLKNLMQNSVIHGHAETLTIDPETTRPGWLNITITDNGKGFTGNLAMLGEAFRPQGPTGGSGLGLSLAKNLLAQMNAALHFPSDIQTDNGTNNSNDAGFRAVIEIPGQLLTTTSRGGRS